MTDSRALSNAIQSGKVAYLEGRSFASNPFTPRENDLRNAWAHGWLDAEVRTYHEAKYG